MITIDIKGDASLIKDIDAFEKRLEKDFERILSDTAKRIRDTARGYAPVRTGRLRDSINIQQPKKYEYSIGTDLFYAQFVEFGTRYQRAQPFMRPASMVGESFILKSMDHAVKVNIASIGCFLKNIASIGGG